MATQITYQVISADGHLVTDGLQPHEARTVAQRIADKRGQSVWLHESHYDPETGETIEPDDKGEEITPS